MNADIDNDQCSQQNDKVFVVVTNISIASAAGIYATVTKAEVTNNLAFPYFKFMKQKFQPYSFLF
jgi:hypothetical protein